jgi:hypothetical protein
MKTKQMLSIKNIAMAAVCLLLSVANTQAVNAQEKEDKVVYTTGQEITVGDTVMINKDSLRYLTGEKKSTWVYDKKHTVGQVGTKRFPNGVLLKEILSWVNPSALLPISIAAPALVEEPVVEPVVEEVVPEPTKEKTDSIKKAVEEVEVEEVVSYKIPVSLEMDRFGLGIRGGFASTVYPNFPLGFDAMLDLRYAHYWAAHENAPYLGIMTGLSAGYMYTHQATVLDSKFQAGDINYHVTATDVDQTTHQVLLELPVMFSMVTQGGFFLNVGPKLMLPVYNPVKQTLNYPTITAYLPELNGEPIKNEVVTGLVNADQCELTGRASNELKIGLAAGLELGYEFSLNNGHSIDLGVYASYGSYFYKTTGVPEGQIISVVAPNDNSVAQVTVNQISEAMTHKLGHFDAGIKFSYNFDFIKK